MRVTQLTTWGQAQITRSMRCGSESTSSTSVTDSGEAQDEALGAEGDRAMKGMPTRTTICRLTGVAEARRRHQDLSTRATRYPQLGTACAKRLAPPPAAVQGQPDPAAEDTPTGNQRHEL